MTPRPEPDPGLPGAPGFSRHDGLLHGSTRPVTYPSSAGGTLTGLLHLPLSPAPDDGWPVVTYAHMTTGAGPRSAPSSAAPGHPEWRRISQGDALCNALLARGVAVLRPDYPGLDPRPGATPAPHPYLIGEPLARSVVDMVAARRELDPRLGDRWVAAGHSEGAVATLFCTVRDDWPVPLLAAAAFAPVTRMDRTIGAASRLPIVPPGTAVVSALVALMLSGAATASADVAAALPHSLSPRARELWPRLAHATLSELSAADSWGALPPSRIAGRDLYAALFEVLRANEVAELAPRVPLRVDAGFLDEVAPHWLTRAAVARWRTSTTVTHRVWRTHHSGVMRPRYAPSEAVEWILRHLET